MTILMRVKRTLLSAPSTCHPGQALVIAAVGFTVLMGIAALTVDVGNIWLQYRALRNLADQAAITGAQVYDNVEGEWPINANSITAARDYITLRGNIACGPPDTVNCRVTSPVTAYGAEGNQYIQIEVSRDFGLGFARVLGFNTQRITATATARTNRPQPSDWAVIAMGGGLVVESGTSTSRALVTGGSDVASWSGITKFGTTSGLINIVNGQAYYEAGATLSSNVTDPWPPVPQSGMSIVAPNPLDGYSWPAPGSCAQTGLRVAADNTDTPPSKFETCGLAGSETLPANAQVTFSSGIYDQVFISPGNTLIFNDGVYRFGSLIANNIQRGDGRRPAVMRMANISPTGPGVYIQIRDQISLTGYIQFNLKGRSALRDTLFHYVGNGTPVPDGTLVINLGNDIISVANGVIYSEAGTIRVRGNACNQQYKDLFSSPQACGPAFSRVTRGVDPNGNTPPITDYGGQVIGRRVVLVIELSTYETGFPNNWTTNSSWVIDYPPKTNRRWPAPTLVPAAP
jgi:Flp pilus assembly protein TadG